MLRFSPYLKGNITGAIAKAAGEHQRNQLEMKLEFKIKYDPYIPEK